ncbi:hypothetical protein [Piscinibacter sp.]|uniref:hypothetical protein n=1 Tax=Piscinibacter sp. TaxID=1903157 RepID=UPI002B9E11ED|nr:hypothetical protein [Albitalea sp.]HUG21871.1 hypothetical protein [Albitalea sp.]
MLFSASRARVGRAASIVLCAFAVSALSVGAASAQTQGREKSFGKATGKSLLLSRDELKACMAVQERLRTGREDAGRQKAELEQQKQELERSATQLEEQLVWLDRYDKEQVDRYNQQAAERDQAIAALQARRTNFNTQAETINADTQAYARNCENRRFDEEDELAIKAGK